MKLLTELKNVDESNSLFETSNLILIAGRPGMGKTTFAVSIGEAIAKTNNVLYISLEHTLENLNKKFYNPKIAINDDTFLTIENLRQQIINSNYSLVIIDYLQLFTNNDKNQIEGLMQITKDLNICMVVLSQLSRDLEYRDITKRRPILSDIENNFSDKIILTYFDKTGFLYRDRYYLPESNDESLELIYDTTIKLYLNKETVRFTDRPQ
jgi:replicative DNA helicase